MKTNTKKNVLFIVLPFLLKGDNVKNFKLRSFKVFPYGILSMATYLKTHAGDKVNIEVLDCNFNDGRDLTSAIKEKLNEFNPDVVGLSMMFDNSYGSIKDISTLVKQHNKNTVVLLGGAAVISSYASILDEQKNIDSICFYEGEIPMLEMINSKDMLDFLEKSPSWITKKSLREGKKPQKNLVQNLDDVVNVDYNFIDVSSYAMGESFSPLSGKIEPRRQFLLVTSRGCPFDCVFCIHSADKDKSVRYASVDAIIKHVKFLVSKYKMNILTINDDQILLNKDRAKQLFRKLAQFKLRIECPNGLSVAFMDDELIGLMKKAGMDTVNLAIESGSSFVLNQIIHKPLKLGVVRPIIQSLRKHGFWIHSFFVFGIPGETDEHRDETVKFIKKIGLDWSSCGLARPVRGSELFKICTENHYIEKSAKIDKFAFNRFIINTPEYSADYVIKKTYLINLDVNFVNNYRMKNGEYAIAADAFRNVIKGYSNHAFAYYYLSKALYGLKQKEKAEKAMKKYREILKTDKEWYRYARYFKLKK